MTMFVPSFQLHRPRTLDEVKGLTAQLEDFDFMGGGTDLLCNYKNHLNAKRDVISLTHLAELKELSPTRIGAGVKLAELEKNQEIAARFPVIHQTLRKIAKLREPDTYAHTHIVRFTIGSRLHAGGLRIATTVCGVRNDWVNRSTRGRGRRHRPTRR